MAWSDFRCSSPWLLPGVACMTKWMASNWTSDVFFFNQALCSHLHVSSKDHKNKKTTSLSKDVHNQRAWEASPEGDGSAKEEASSHLGACKQQASSSNPAQSLTGLCAPRLTVCWVLRTKQIGRVSSRPPQSSQTMSVPAMLGSVDRISYPKA